MRLLLVIALLALTGCKFGSPVPLPAQPDAPTSPSSIKQAGTTLEAQSQKVAAAVTVIRENAAKEAVVKAESAVALSMLPKPSDGDLAVARLRAANPADQKAYAAAEEYGRKLLSKITSDWSKLAADQAEAKRVSDLKDARIKQLEEELDRVKKDKDAQWWTMAGVAVAVAGAFATAFASPKVGVPLLLCGGAIGAFPHVVDLPWFKWIAGGFLATLAGLGIWVAYDAARDQVHESDPKPQPSSDDEQAPPQI